MKLTPALFSLALCLVAATRIQAQTLNWGNDFGDLSDSNGGALDNTFVFELGSFVVDFVPTATNTDLWNSNWRVFDQAAFNEGNQYFTSTVYVENGVTSSNPIAGSFSFAGLNAYIWIRNDDDPVEGTEWLLTRADNWTFPLVGGDCCNTEIIQWSVSDLEPSDTPLWGNQGGVSGPGVSTTTSGSGLQTFTFVPEPSTALLTVVAGLGMVLRRRRVD